MSREHPTLTLTGSKEVMEINGDQKPTILVQDASDPPTANSVKFAVKGDGNVYGTSLQIKTEFTVDENGNVQANDISCDLVEAPMMSSSYVLLQNTVAGKHQLLIGKDADGEITFQLFSDGEMRFLHNLEDHAQPATVASSIITSDGSVYIGSARLSYDRPNHKLTLYRLKQNHIPVYLEGRGFDASHLPGGHVHNDMSVRKWLIHAKKHFGEKNLDVRDVFPPGNADWEVAVDGSIWAAFYHQGQVCESGTRLLLSTKDHDGFVEQMVEKLNAMLIMRNYEGFMKESGGPRGWGRRA